MSWRTYVGDGKREWADENSSDYSSLDELAKAVAWQMPAKLGTTDPGRALELLKILDEEYSMPPSEFWSIWITGKSPIEHPTWDEVREYFSMIPQEITS